MLSIMMCVGITSQAQLDVTPNPTLDEITQRIIGPGFKVTGATLNCPANAFALFDGTNTNLGLNEGLLLTSGSAMEAIGPNDTESKGVNNGAPGDAQLTTISGAPTFDGCVLEIDLIPSCDTLRISYVFGSEEYPEFVGKEFNDVFAFFVSGPGIVGNQNVALLPGTTTPVSVNSVNAGQNNNYYVNNNQASIQYDGFTTVMEGKVAVQSCESYHLKLAIADVVDGIYESGVFIQQNSVKCNTEIISANTADVLNAIEGCKDGQFSLIRSGDLVNASTINYQILGSATMGVDYENIPTSITFPAGESTVNIDVKALVDSEVELDESVKLVFQPGPCPIYDTITLEIKDLKYLDSGQDVEACSEVSVNIGFDSIPGATYSWDPVLGLDDPTAINTKLILENNTLINQEYEYIQTAYFDGCESKDTVSVVIFPKPQITIASENACLETEVGFTPNGNVNDINSWQWDFGDDYVSLDEAPNHTYTESGNFKVELIVVDDNSCIGSDSLEIEIWDLPEADFNVIGLCEDDSIRLENLSTGGIKSYNWDFGDEIGESTEEDPGYVYVAPNIYEITLEVESDSGCFGSTSQSLNVRPRPKADFNSTEVCLYSTTEFDEAASIANGVVTKFSWDFGDGVVDTLEDNPNHVFANPGDYDVRLAVESGYGCIDTVVKSVKVKDLPNAGFYGENVCIGTATRFTDTSTTKNVEAITNWKWNFDNSFISTEQNPVVVFADTGLYEIILIASTDYGCSDTIDGTVLVLPNPIVDFGPEDVCEGQENVFNNKSFVVNPKDTIKTYVWDFGDGSAPKFGKIPIHTYSEPKEFLITMTATTDSGCVSSKSKPVYVHGKPETDFFAQEACANSETEFTNKTTVADGYIEKVFWDFNGEAVDSINNYPSYRFNGSGDFPVTLNTISNFGCIDSVSKLAVVNENPSIELNGAIDHCFGSEVSLKAENLINPIGGGVTYKWSFGDGSVEQTTVPSTSHLYDLEGEYYVGLSILNEKGCADTIIDSLIVTGTPEIQLINNGVCIGDSNVFSIMIENDANFNWVSVDWDFGDGFNTTDDTLVAHTYNTTGEFEVEAVVSSDSGCIVSVSSLTNVYEFPVAAFVVDTVCFGRSSKFLSNSNAPMGSYINKWEWETSYGEIGFGSNFTHVMQDHGADSVSLIVTTNNGCIDTSIQEVFTVEAPVVDFIVGEVEGCAPFCVVMTSEIITDNYAMTNIFWDLGDGNISLDTNPVFCFNEPGKFTVELTVENELGCSGTKVKDDVVSVVASPSGGFITDYSVISEHTADIKVFNTAPSYRQTKWIMGDGNVFIGDDDFSHSYDSSGTYLIQQVVENEAGCTDTVSRKIFVKREDGIYIPNTFTPGASLGRNDYFFPEIYGTLREAKYEMVIYNRWGNLVFKTNDIDGKWDGTFMGHQAQEDVYVYKLKFHPLGAEDGDFIMYKGHINLLR